MSRPAGYDALRGDVGAVVLPRDVIVATGPDTVTFLQGQLSQDVAGLAIGASAWSFLLAPTGKVDSWLRVTRTGETDVELDVDAGWGTPTLARLERFKIRTKCEFALRSTRSIAVRGPKSGSARDGARPAREIGWPGVDGFDLVGDDAAVPSDVTEVSIDAYERLRIETGVPHLGAELTDRTIPAEAGAWIIEASVSFTKGCYTGQELVARIDSRGGNVPRHLRGLVAREGATVPVGAEIRVDGKAVGEVTSAAGDVGLGYVARAVEPSATVDLVAPNGEPVVADVRTLPIESDES